MNKLKECTGNDRSIREIRAIEAAGGKPIPAIALTAYATEQDRQAALSAGFQEHLSKV